ncbi:hypothetical protein O181_010531 [Austropuccinia psidii MF-1]|uniref:NADH dehydrogenase [ubiquinone] 1 alpha subcomplex subunit 1 n=1 Tax=Austropuccinia psidii MF-1 TaxID=1389203 RepID=A0A9Q3GKH7_9BASI|nr:hypothetical protein [Austropuccinia psidii MF-1]
MARLPIQALKYDVKRQGSAGPDQSLREGAFHVTALPPRLITMPVPWEAFIPIGLLTVMFGAAGTLLNTTRRLANDGKPPRYNVDKWDEMMMERDRRLTGKTRGQCVEEKAPLAFQTNSAWPVEKIL